MAKTGKAIVETHTRTVIKAISWRVVATCISMTIVFILTRKIILTLEFGVIEVLAKLTFYYLHDRTWQKVTWGTKTHPLAGIPVNRELTPEDMDKVKKQLRDLGYLD